MDISTATAKDAVRIFCNGRGIKYTRLTAHLTNRPTAFGLPRWFVVVNFEGLENHTSLPALCDFASNQGFFLGLAGF